MDDCQGKGTVYAKCKLGIPKSKSRKYKKLNFRKERTNRHLREDTMNDCQEREQFLQNVNW